MGARSWGLARPVNQSRGRTWELNVDNNIEINKTKGEYYDFLSLMFYYFFKDFYTLKQYIYIMYA